ncbi:glycoprotein-N-acetylgalactosamine 3-beta-galactosyltransferase 1-like [Condylostylus longicornis]|uniref:glycoprotein-N-acetylgalactosamine 3-beta-galactosyltransferase 1-like n=1 Tax=Condylostylus longicornis TaxID=2530218 RepID=UPI00244E3573|nr:glycoprotein-N-acetylgalactosamine 3-beta-galactosyltransferase 1-like [Condylostylus longicornis]
MENLRFMLNPHDSLTPIYFGSKQQYLNVTFMANDPGYVLSKEAIQRFYELLSSISPPENCNLDGYGNEDIELGKCLQTIGVLPDNRVLYSQRLFISLIIGFIAGLSIGYFLVITSDPNYQYYLYHKSMQIEDYIEVSSNNIIEHVHESENTTIAETLYDRVKILCWVITEPQNHATRAKYVKQTWGKRCNKLIFISTEDDEELGAIGVTPKIPQYWGITISTLQYIYENHLNEYDWFLKADEATYVIVENLRYMLNSHNSDVPIWFGSKHQSPEADYNSRGAGYVLSREAVRQFIENVLPSPKPGCNIEGYGYDDFELGLCFKTINVINGDSRDSEGRTRFFPLALADHLLSQRDGPKDWFYDRIYYKTGFMFTIEFVIYHLRPYGIWSMPFDIPTEKYTLEDELRLVKEAEKDRIIV